MKRKWMVAAAAGVLLLVSAGCTALRKRETDPKRLEANLPQSVEDQGWRTQAETEHLREIFFCRGMLLGGGGLFRPNPRGT